MINDNQQFSRVKNGSVSTSEKMADQPVCRRKPAAAQTSGTALGLAAPPLGHAAAAAPARRYQRLAAAAGCTPPQAPERVRESPTLGDAGRRRHFGGSTVHPPRGEARAAALPGRWRSGAPPPPGVVGVGLLVCCLTMRMPMLNIRRGC